MQGPALTGPALMWKADYSKEHQLIIPFPWLPEECVVIDEDDLTVLHIHDRLYIAAAYDATTEVTCAAFNDVRLVTRPCPVEGNGASRWLLYKEAPGTGCPCPPSAQEIHDFLSDTAFEKDLGYLRRLLSHGEEAWVAREDGLIRSLAYSTKGRRQLNSLYTDPAHRGRGHATSLLSMCGPVHLFVDDRKLLPFYTARGFSIRRAYEEIRL